MSAQDVARASHVAITLCEEPGQLGCTIRDDGAGFDLDRVGQLLLHIRGVRHHQNLSEAGPQPCERTEEAIAVLRELPDAYNPPQRGPHLAWALLGSGAAGALVGLALFAIPVYLLPPPRAIMAGIAALAMRNAPVRLTRITRSQAASSISSTVAARSLSAAP